MSNNQNELGPAPFIDMPFDGSIPPPPETEQEKDSLALDDFLLSAGGGIQFDPPPQEHAEVSFDNIGDLDAKGSVTHPFVNFFSHKLSELDSQKSNKDKKYNGFVNKNLKSGWFSEYNASTKEKDPTHTVFCKPDSLFFIESDSIADALKQSGLTEERANALQDKFDFVFIGNTSSRSRQSNDKANSEGIKTYVLGLKDPLAPDAAEIFAEFKAARDQHIRAEIDSGKSLDSAVEEVLLHKDEITNAVKGNRFFGAEDKLFLNNSATRAFLDTIPGVKGQYAVYPVKHESNKVKYFGEAPKMDSFFTDNIEICEVKALKDGKLSQDELEHKVKDALEKHSGHVMRTPQSAFTKQTVVSEAEKKADKESAAEVSLEGSEKPKGGKDKREQNDPDYADYKKRQAKQQESDENDQKKSVAAAVAETAAKLTAATLEALVAIAKLIVAMLMALLQLLLKGINMAARQFNPNFPVREGPSLINTLNEIKFSKRNSAEKGMTYAHDPNANDKAESAKSLDNAISDNALALNVIPDADTKNAPDLKADIAGELDKLKADFTIDKEALAETEIKDFTDEQLEELKAEASNRLNELSDGQIAEFIKSLELKTVHSISPDLEAKLAPNSIYHLEHGILLAKNDKVLLENGVEAGVLAAFTVAGKLHYATAHEKDGQYSIAYTPANALTLLEHNSIKFDNEPNLIDQAVNSIMEKHGAEGKVAQVEILNHVAPSENSLTIRELAALAPFVSKHQLGFDLSPIDVPELVGRNMKYHTELYKSIPQLHTDRSGEPTNIRSGQTHPMYGRLLDINDQVESILPNGKIKVEGAVVGSYSYNDDLYYQVMAENQVYNLKASDLTLLKYNGGELAENEITQRAIDKLFIGNGKTIGANADAKPAGMVDIPLRHINGPSINIENPLGVHQVQQDLTNAKIALPGTSNVGITPLNYKDGQAEGAGIIYTMGKSHFVSLGETTDPVNGMKRAVCAEIKKSGNTFAGMPAANSRMVQLNLDDPNVMIAKNGLSGSDVMESVKILAAKAVAIYETGGLKKQAVLMAKFGNELKSEILADKSKFIDLAKESVIQNELAAKILEAKATVSLPTPAHEMGLSANLANSEIDLSAVNQQIEVPDATLTMEAPPLVADAQTLQPNEIIESAYLANESFNSLSQQLYMEDQGSTPSEPQDENGLERQDLLVIDLPEPSPVPVNTPEIHTEETAQAAPAMVDNNTGNPKDGKVSAVEPEGLTEIRQEEAAPESPAATIEQGYERISTLTLVNAAEDVGQGPHADSVKFVATYLTGNQYVTNENGAWDLLSEKAELTEMRTEFFEKASSVMHALSPAFQEIKFVHGIPDFEHSNLADPVKLQKIIADDPDLRTRIKDLSITGANYQELYSEHLDRVAETVSEINNRFNYDSLKGDDLDNVNTARNALAHNSLEKLNDITNISNFAYGVSEMGTKEDIDYASLVGSISEIAASAKEHALNRVGAISQTFNKLDEKAIESKASLGNDLIS